MNCVNPLKEIIEKGANLHAMQSVAIEKIKPNPNNPRIIKDDKFKKLVKSIAEFPEMMFKRPLVCVTDTDGKIYPLGGNMRLKAFPEALQLMNGKAKLFKDGIPIELADEWTEEQRREFVIKDNVGFGEWDWGMIANDWDQEQVTALEVKKNGQPYKKTETIQ